MQKLFRIHIGIAFLIISINSFGQSDTMGICKNNGCRCWTNVPSNTISISMGPTYSKPHVKNASETSTKYATYSDALISVIGQHNFNRNFGLILDIGLCHRGMAVTQPVTVAVTDPNDLNVSYQYKNDKYRKELSYLDNYLMAKYTLIDKFKVYGNAGAYYSVLLRARNFIADEYYDDNGSYGITEIHDVRTGNIRSSYKKSDLGFAVGGGLEYGRFGLDYRYCVGIINTSSTPEINKVYSSFSTVKLTFVMARISK